MLEAGADEAEDEPIAWCRERMAAHEYPREVRLVAELPHGPDRQDPREAAALTAPRAPVRGPVVG